MKDSQEKIRKRSTADNATTTDRKTDQLLKRRLVDVFDAAEEDRPLGTTQVQISDFAG